MARERSIPAGTDSFPVRLELASSGGGILYRASQYEEAIAQYLRALDLNPGYLPVLGRVVGASIQLGKYDQAAAYIERLQRIAANPRQGLRSQALIYARLSKRPEAMEILRAIEKAGTPGGDVPALVVVYTAPGEHDHATEALEKGVEAPSVLPGVFADPQLDPLRSDLVLQQLLDRTGIPV